MTAIIRDLLYGLRHQPEVTRESIADILERDVLATLEEPQPDSLDAERAEADLTNIVDLIQPAISDAYYDARNAGETMEDAASRAAGAVLAILQDRALAARLRESSREAR